MTLSFAQQYGPWAVIAGASEGTGRAFARQVAAQGVNLVLAARREEPLNSLAAEIVAESGVECAVVSVDLTQPEAAATLIKATAGREVGLYISNAGSDTQGVAFLDRAIDSWLDLIHLNTLTALRCCHHFGAAMRERGRGGILLVGSGACYGGGPSLATYAGAKAFNLSFAEGLWAELEPHGVDVLFYALGRTDTPALHQMLADKNVPVPAGLADPTEVARMGLTRLPFGPVANWDAGDHEPGPGGSSAAERRQRVRKITELSRSVLGE